MNRKSYQKIETCSGNCFEFQFQRSHNNANQKKRGSFVGVKELAKHFNKKLKDQIEGKRNEKLPKMKKLKQKFKCRECSYKTRKEKRLGDHVQNSHSLFDYMCLDCKKTFKSSNDLEIHNITTHGEMIVKEVLQKECEIDKNFTAQTSQMEKESFPCEHCDFTGTTAGWNHKERR